MGTTWFTSDLHIRHRMVAALRGYDDVAEHDAHLASIWNAYIRADDIVWVLGDISLNPAAGVEWIGTVNGRKHLIAGNHDRCSPVFRDSHKEQKRYLTVFESVQTMARHKINGENVFLSHFPYTQDRGDEERAAQYRLRNEGAWLLHGHTHNQIIRTSACEIHVGIDAWKRPVALYEIAEEMTRDYAPGPT